MQNKRPPLSRRTTLALGVLIVGALSSLIWTSNTAWWPWSSEASSIQIARTDEQLGNEAEDPPLPRPVDVTTPPAGETASESPATAPPTEELDGEAPKPTQVYHQGNLPSGGLSGIPKNIQEKLKTEGGTLQVDSEGKYTYRAPDGAETKGGGSQGECTTPAGSLIDPCASLAANVQKIYKESISLMLLLAFLILVYAGYRYVTSLGNPEATKDAKDWGVSAVTGIALLLLIPLIMQALGIGS